MIVELEGYLIRPEDVSCVTPIYPLYSTVLASREKLGAKPDKKHYFYVFFRGGGQIVLYEEASREKLVQAVKSVIVRRPSCIARSGPTAAEFENRVRAIVEYTIKDAVS